MSKRFAWQANGSIVSHHDDDAEEDLADVVGAV